MRADNTERLERLLAALERELVEATDQEILEAAGELGMNPAMKGSAAFIGIATIYAPPFQSMDPSEPSEWPRFGSRSKDEPPR